MEKKSRVTKEEDISGGLFRDRDDLLGKGRRIDPAELDPVLLWWVVLTLANRSASIQLGVTRDGGAWAVQYWDGKVPIKEYYNTTRELNWSFAGLLVAAFKKDLPAELIQVVREYGW